MRSARGGADFPGDGVDVPGRSLRLIVFDRVPWPRPDILHRARKAVFGGVAYDDRITRLRLRQAYGRLVRRALKEAGLSWFDRILGGALGVVRGGLMVAVVLMGMAAFTPTSKWLEGSQLAPYFLVVGRAAIWVAPSELRARFYQGLDLLRRQHQQLAPATESKRPAQ